MAGSPCSSILPEHPSLSGKRNKPESIGSSKGRVIADWSTASSLRMTRNQIPNWSRSQTPMKDWTASSIQTLNSGKNRNRSLNQNRTRNPNQSQTRNLPRPPEEPLSPSFAQFADRR